MSLNSGLFGPTALTSAPIPFGMEKALTTSIVPEKYLETAFLVGLFPMISLRSEPRVSYGLYIPKAHYNPRENPTTGKLPLLVDIHGTGRILAIQVRDQLFQSADEIGFAVLSPLFPVGFDNANDLNSYKLLRTHSLRSDMVLLSILEEVAYRWPGIDTRKIYMSGFSGGGQFVHRFLYLHAHRIAAASVGAPGRVTYPDTSKTWPEGIANIESLFGQQAQLDKMKDVSLQFVIGEKDTELYGCSEFWNWVKKVVRSPDDLPPMDESRMQTLQKLRDSWTQRGIESKLSIVAGEGHNETSPAIRKDLWDFLIDNIKAAKIKSRSR